MRILHVITSLGLGGAQVMLRRYLEALGPDAAGHRVATLLPEAAVGREIAALGVPVSHLGADSLPSLPLAAVRLRRLVGEVRPDAVHGWMYHACLAAELTARASAPVVWGIHHSLADIGNERRRTRLVLRALARLSQRADAIVYCGASIARQHERIGFSGARRTVIPNGIDCTEFRPRPGAGERLRTELGLPEGRLLIGNFARDHPMKDPATLVRAVARLVADGVDVQAVFMGEGQVGGAAREAARALGVDERITTLPARAGVAGVVAGLDVYAQCSAWGESFSLAMAEAMSAGIPAVSTDVGDTGWVLGDRSRLVPPRDDEALSGALSRLARMPPGERRRMGMDDRARVASLFSIRSYVAAHDALYRRAACAARSGGRLAAE